MTTTEINQQVSTAVQFFNLGEACGQMMRLAEKAFGAVPAGIFKGAWGEAQRFGLTRDSLEERCFTTGFLAGLGQDSIFVKEA